MTDAKTSQRFAPCPFCGRENITFKRITQTDSDRFGFYVVTCQDCDCRLTGETERQVVGKWNDRIPERINSVLAAKLRRLETMLDDRYAGRISPEAKRTMMLNRNRR